MIEQASLVIGNCNWANKEGSLLGYKLIDGKYYAREIDAVRATTATRINAQGLVELVPYNLFSYSEQFTNAYWLKAAGGGVSLPTITENTTIAPNGTTTADTIVFPAVSGSQFSFIYNEPGVVGNYTTSIYLKGASGGEIIWISWTNDGVNYLRKQLTLTTSWERYDYTANVPATNQGVIFGIDLRDSQQSAKPSQTIYAWGAQLNEGTLKDYQKTETRLNIPRLDYSNGTCPSLLVEPQRTNITTYSEQFDNAGWSKYIGSVTANATTSPNGTTTADKFIDSTDNDIHAIYKAYTISGDTTFSIYVKAAEYSKIAFTNLSDSGTAKFDLSNGTIISTAANWKNSTIESINNGWYRISSTTNGVSGAKAIGTSLLNSSNQEVFVGTGTSGIFLWGAQVEAGSYATSYIPTTSASVTRNADVISKTGISSLIGQTEGVVFMDFEYKNLDTGGLIPIFLSNTSSNQFYLIITPNERMLAEYYFSDVTQASISTATGFAQPNTRYKIAMAYKANDFAFYINGQLIGTDSSGSVSGLNDLALNYLFGSNYGPTGQNINSIALWKTRLTNTQLAELTTL